MRLRDQCSNLVLALTTLLLLVACGQKGDLYLDDGRASIAPVMEDDSEPADDDDERDDGGADTDMASWR
jgi:predicted small lipoprotein YifL